MNMPAATETFVGQVVTDVAAALSGVMTSIGNKLGLYTAMANAGPLSSQQLAEKTALTERYVREWLNNQTAGGYIHYHADTQCYELPDAHIPVLADPDSPLFLIPALEVGASLWMDEDKLIEVFKNGSGIAWGQHHHRLFCGSESLFRPGYKAFLTTQWITAMEGIQAKLVAGARVADVGCGHGASTIVMAETYPNSQFYGFDNHPHSIETAGHRAEEAGVTDNIHFQIAKAKDYQESGFDLICFMDCLHDMGDPVGAAQHAAAALNPDGRLLLVEPAAADDVQHNINPVSRLYYAASTAVCTPCSLSQEVGLALGAQAGQRRLSEVLIEAGFSEVKRIAETPFNIVLEARL
jgi:2-polyprenyl-3-methyl-5-hydroxy-6-metoxy-1,4-benzoquinol methylase